jgi:hypothetical protein
MGNSQVSQLTPQEQHQIIHQFDKTNKNLYKELDKLESKNKEDIEYIKKLKLDLTKQRAMLHPFNTTEYDNTTQQGTSVQPSQTGDWQHWKNWQNINQQSNNPSVQSPNATQSQGLLSGVMPSSLSNLSTNGSNCQSTVNGGVCNSTLTAMNGICKFNAQTDGNLVVYNKNNKPVWNSRTNGQGVAPYKLTMQPTGNLLWTDSNNTTLWQSNTGGQGVAPYRAHINEQCNFSILDSKNNSIWSTNTTGMGNN